MASASKRTKAIREQIELGKVLKILCLCKRNGKKQKQYCE